MTAKEIDWIAVAALIVSIVALFLAWRAAKKGETNSRENLNLQHALIENELRQAVELSNAKINDLAVLMTPYDVKVGLGSASTEETKILEAYHRSLNAAIQGMLNTYDGICAKYLDGKIDKIRFKATYNVEIRNLVEKKELKDYFDPTTSRYKTILNVYTEWNS